MPNFVDGLTGADFTEEETTVYAATRLRPLELLSVILGLRAVDWTSKGESYGEPENIADDRVLPYTGVVWQLAADWMAYGSYVETFMPQADVDINRDRLKPADGVNQELGIKAGLMDGALIATLALFQAEFNNLFEYAGFYSGETESYSYYEGLDYESQGYELEVTGKIGKSLTVIAGHTDLSVEGEDGQRARLHPRADAADGGAVEHVVPAAAQAGGVRGLAVRHGLHAGRWQPAGGAGRLQHGGRIRPLRHQPQPEPVGSRQQPRQREVLEQPVLGAGPLLRADQRHGDGDLAVLSGQWG